MPRSAPPGRRAGWYQFVHRATPRQLALFGFPPPGHPYWTEATLTGTAQRYPGLEMTPWRRALPGEARPGGNAISPA